MKTKFYNRHKLNKAKLILAMSAIVFLLVSVNFIGFWIIGVILYKIPFIDIEKLPHYTNIYILGALSLIIGIVLSMIFRKYILIPLHESYLAMGKMADGIFDVNVDVKGIRAVRRITKSINVTARELDNLESMRNDFINNFSHEFKTPIVSIAGFAKLLRNPDISQQEKDEYLDIIISESDRLSQLSANVLSLSKLSSQTILTGIKKFDVTEQIRQAIILLEHKWSAKNITMSCENRDYTIWANEELLKQVWINLLDNAIKFSPEGSEIKTAITKDDGRMIFTFRDEGKGMSEETARHAFEKFYQGDNTHSSGGAGIGLAIVKRICELHGGDVIIKSTGEKGTVFEVTLPIEK